MRFFGISIILLILILGGVIAFIGNTLGRAMGKKRLSIFKMRPRYTATLFTILAGTIIALVTLGLAAMISNNFRTALFGLDELRNNLVETKGELKQQKGELALKLAERDTLENKLEEINFRLKNAQKKIKNAEQKINSLYLAKEKLAEEVLRARKGKLLFKKGERLITSLFKSPSKIKNLSALLKQILSAADQRVRSYGVKSQRHLIYFSPNDFDLLSEKLNAEKKDTIVQIVTARNTLWGEIVHCTFKAIPNNLVYKKGEEITYTGINGRLSTPAIEQQVLLLLEQAHVLARLQGIIPYKGGNIGSIPYAEIFELSKKISSKKRKVELAITAKKDIYTLGPLEVTFKLF